MFKIIQKILPRIPRQPNEVAWLSKWCLFLLVGFEFNHRESKTDCKFQGGRLPSAHSKHGLTGILISETDLQQANGAGTGLPDHVHSLDYE